MREKKQHLRARLTLHRESLASAKLRVWSRIIQQTALEFPIYRAAPNVVLYSSFGNEVATADISEHAFKSGKSVFYPRTIERGWVDLVRVLSHEVLRPGTYGIPEPPDGPAIIPQELHTGIVFVPGVAFDLNGGRLGRGHGAYDRLLARCQDQLKSIALAYEFQIVENVPMDEWDRSVHYIITERRIINCLGADPALLNRTC